MSRPAGREYLTDLVAAEDRAIKACLPEGDVHLIYGWDFVILRRI